MSKTIFKVTSILLFLFCFRIDILGQTNDKILTLLEFPNSKYQTIVNGRKVLYKRLICKDTSSVLEILNYLTTKIEDDKYLPLFPQERLLYYYWIRQYDQVINFIPNYDSLYVSQLKKKKFPPFDDITNKIVDQLRLERNSIYDEISSIDKYGDEDKDFLTLNFDQLLSWGMGKDIAIDGLNERVSNFLKKYPESKHNKYIKDHIGIDFKTSKWNFSGEYFSGFSFYNDKVGKSLYPVIPVGITIDVRYFHFGIRIIDYIGFSKTKDTIYTKKATWRKNASARVLIPGITIGYFFVDNKKFKLYPFIGISSTSIGPPFFQSEKPENENVGFDFTSTITYGISLDVFIKPEKETDFNWLSRDLHYFRLTYMYYQPKFQRKYAGYDGNMHSITIGYVMFNNPRRRIK
jgi:hypothetical protein